MDTRQKFEAALAARKKQAAEDSLRGKGNWTNFPDIPYSALYTDKQQAFRFVGLPYTVREKPTDSKRIFVSMILGDDDKRFRCIGPDPQEHKDWIVYRVMNKVLSKHWDKNIQRSDGKMGDYVYDYVKTHPDLYLRVAKNNNNGNPYESGWRFSPSVLFNVIDRENYEWHKTNKKYRVLSKRASESGDKIYFDPGVPDTVFNNIMDDIVALDGNTNWEDYDIVIKKTKEQPWYKVYHGTDDQKRIEENVRSVIVPTGLSDEEKSWELNNFDELYKVTSYMRIKSKLGLFFQKVDKALGTAYYDELCTLVDKEEQEKANDAIANAPLRGGSASSQVAAPAPMSVPPTPPVSSAPIASAAPVTPTSNVPLSSPQITPTQNSTPQVQQAIPTSTSAPTSTPIPASTPTPTASSILADGSILMNDAIWNELATGVRKFREQPFNGIALMTAEEKSMVTAIKPDGQFIWKPEAGELLECGRSGFLSPQMVHVDPVSAQVFED